MQKQEAIKAFGGVAALAKALRVTPAAIYQWGDSVPELRVFQIRQLMSESGASAPAGAAARGRAGLENNIPTSPASNPKGQAA